MTKEINAKAIFDNGGGITLQLGGYAHWYDSVKQAAVDFKEYMSTGNTDDWDGHEPESLELDPDYDEIRNGGYRVYTDTDVTDALGQEEPNSWGNINDFCEALKKLGEQFPLSSATKKLLR